MFLTPPGYLWMFLVPPHLLPFTPDTLAEAPPTFTFTPNIRSIHDKPQLLQMSGLTFQTTDILQIKDTGTHLQVNERRFCKLPHQFCR